MHFNISFKKETYPIEIDEDRTIFDLKTVINTVLDVPVETQKLLYKGKLDDDKLVNSLPDNAKILLIGSRAEEISNVKEHKVEMDWSMLDKVKEVRWQDYAKHRNVLSKGPFSDVSYERSEDSSPLPVNKEVGNLMNAFGQRTRIAFLGDVLRISTSGGQYFVSMKEILDLDFQEVLTNTGDPTGYGILWLKTIGASLSKDTFFYFVPTKYVNAIRIIISLGKSMNF